MSLLKDLIKTDCSGYTAVVEFKDQMRFTVRYLSRVKARAIAEASSYVGYSSQEKGRSKQLDGEKLIDALLKHIVIGWSGITLRKLSKHMPLETGGMLDSELDADLPFTQADLKMIVEGVKDLDGFLNECATELSTFETAAQPDAEKNS